MKVQPEVPRTDPLLLSGLFGYWITPLVEQAMRAGSYGPERVWLQRRRRFGLAVLLVLIGFVKCVVSLRVERANKTNKYVAVSATTYILYSP